MTPTTESIEVSEWHEQCMKWLLRRSGLSVVRKPHINGKRPDLLATQPDGPSVIIECLVKLQYPAHAEEIRQGVHICGGDIKELHGALYSRVEEKAAKYRNLDGPYVVAVYDEGCMNYVDTALALAFSAYTPYIKLNSKGDVVGRGHSDQWSTPERSASLFKLYPNISGLIYSRWKREHHFVSNPWANAPVSADLFPFARVPDNPPIIDEKPIWEARDPLFKDEYWLPPNTYWGQIQRLMQSIMKLIDSRQGDSMP